MAGGSTYVYLYLKNGQVSSFTVSENLAVRLRKAIGDGDHFVNIADDEGAVFLNLSDESDIVALNMHQSKG